MIFIKRLSKTPYVKQFNENACGPAVLEMIYRYYGIKNVSQEKIYEEYRELDSHSPGNYLMTTDNIVIDARKRGFASFWGRADYDNIENTVKLLKVFIEKLKTPVIVCQKFSEEEPLIGHFRIVLSLDKDFIYLHDPYIGVRFQKWPIQKFFDFWKPTGLNVTGGVFIIIKK